MFAFFIANSYEIGYALFAMPRGANSLGTRRSRMSAAIIARCWRMLHGERRAQSDLLCCWQNWLGIKPDAVSSFKGLGCLNLTILSACGTGAGYMDVHVAVHALPQQKKAIPKLERSPWGHCGHASQATLAFHDLGATSSSAFQASMIR